MSNDDADIIPVDETPADTNPSYEKLKKLRQRTDLEVRPSALLRTSFVGFDGVGRPLKLRYYQVQGVMHLLAMKRFLLGDDTGLGKCVSRDTLVLTDRGLLEIGSLGPAETKPDTFYPLSQPTEVWTGWKWAPVKSFYSSGVKPTQKVVTRRGYEITGSLVHPLWVRGPKGESFIPIGQLVGENYVCIDREGGAFPQGEPQLPIPGDRGGGARTFPVPRSLTPDLAALLAYVVAEGWTAGRYGFSVTQHRDKNPETHDHIRHLCQTVLGWTGNDTSKKKDTTISVSSLYLRDYLTGLGIDQSLSAGKQVPWPIFQGTRESVASFLRAFFDSEGSVSSAVVEVSSASERLLREVQVLLLRFGILCTRSSKKMKGYDHTYWKLTLCGDDARAFAAHIGFLTPRKSQALAALCGKKSNTNLDVVPYAKRLVRDLRTHLFNAVARTGSNGNRTGSGIKQFGVSFEKALNNIQNCGRDPSRRFLAELLNVAERVGVNHTDAYRALDAIRESNFFYDPVASVTPGQGEVVDIEVDDPDHSFVGNGMVNHNTLQAIAALCYLWERTADLKVVIFTSKSAVEQWAGEFTKFTLGVTTFVCKGSPAARQKVRDKFWAASGPTVLIMGYRTAVQDIADLQDHEGYVFITDEAAAYKNASTHVHQVCKHLSSKAERTWALTATLIKNNLIEGWGVYAVVVPGLFGTKNHFMSNYCITRMMQLPGSRRQVPTIVGYKDRDIAEFRKKIDPFYLGRPKFEVASELPPLITRTISVGMNSEQEAKYQEALEGLLVVGVKTGTSEEKEVSKLTAVTYCQQIVNHPELIGCDGDSEKLDALIDLLGDGGELNGEKVIVFTRFRKMVDILTPALKKAKIRSVRITGTEDEKARKASQDDFQDPKSDALVCCITTAAAEAINLQTAKAIIFYDTPWSAGDYLQILGRMIRIGSTHDRCFAIHLVTKGTIDDRVMQVLLKKMVLVEAVLGKRIKGDQDTGVIVDVTNDLSDLFDGLIQDARSRRK